MTTHSDYFEVMNMPHKMGLDSKALEKTFYTLSRKFHPDFFENKSEKEKLWSRVQTASLNKAYEVLKDPVERAKYLLSLEAPEPEEERSKIDPMLVAEIFEIQEMVEEEKETEDPALQVKLQDAKKEVEEKINTRRQSLGGHFKGWDALEDAPTKKQDLAKTIRKTIHEITYLKNLIQSIETRGQIRH